MLPSFLHTFSIFSYSDKENNFFFVEEKGEYMPEPRRTSCGCPRSHNTLVSEIYEHLSMSGAPLAMGYIPYQKWNETYPLCKALKIGTIFPDLNKPFCGKGGKCE